LATPNLVVPRYEGEGPSGLWLAAGQPVPSSA
jgi:hypothetical protein